MTGLKKHLLLFPERIRRSLLGYKDWERITEIRLRSNLPLSLTHFSGNLFLDEMGNVSEIKKALRATPEEVRHVVCTFCNGNLYRYFNTLQEGFLVDDEGFRLSVCPEKNEGSSYLPERFAGINLRIPRAITGASLPLLRYFQEKPLASTLILSPPGAGKTTLLRDLAINLSRGGKQFSPFRVAVIDERKEIFPPIFLQQSGLCDILSGYSKGEGIKIALRLFSPEIILCDEIGGLEDSNAILSTTSAGCMMFASAHAHCLEEALARPFLRTLLTAKVFRHVAEIQRTANHSQFFHLQMRDFS